MKPIKQFITDRYFPIYLFLISLIIRLLFCFITFYITGTNDWSDDWNYIHVAKEIIRQGILLPDLVQLNSCVGPFYPMVIAASFKLFGETYIPLLLLNCFLNAGLSVVIYFIGKQTFSEKVGISSGIWSIFYLEFIRYCPHLLKECLLFFLFAFIIYLLIRTAKSKRIQINLLIGAFLYVILIHLDERYFIYFPIFTLSLIFLQSKSMFLGLKKGFIFIFLVIVFMIPWLARNYSVYGRPIILTERTAKFTDPLFGYKSDDIVFSAESSKHHQENSYKILIDSINKGFDVKIIDKETARLIREQTIKNRGPHRFDKSERILKETYNMWTPARFGLGFINDGYRPIMWSPLHNLYLILNYGILLPFFLFGIYFIFKEKNKIGIFFVVIVLVHTLIHVLLAWVVYRYRLPVDFIVILISFFGFFKTIDFFKNIKTIRALNKPS